MTSLKAVVVALAVASVLAWIILFVAMYFQII